MQTPKAISLLIVVVALALFASCKKEGGIDPVLPQPTDSLQKINRWVLDSMIKYYLWSDDYGTFPSLSESTPDFYRRLLNTTDEFSWITNGGSIGPEKSTYESFGFQYLLVSIPSYSSTSLVGVVSLVAPGSPAANAGLKRGDYFSKVNSQPISDQNKAQIITALQQSSPLKVTMLTNTAGVWAEGVVKTMSSAYYEERPVFVRKVFRYNNIVTGYLFYNQFTETFDRDVLDALDSFRVKNVQELIIDLRYNPGGSVATAAKISAMLLKNINATETFSYYAGNSKLGLNKQSFDKAVLSSGNAYRRSFDQLHSQALTLNRIFLLTGDHSASAAEMLVNNLKPYITVVQIGEKTRGKDKAGVLIKDLRQPKQVYWQLYPMVFRIQNANQQGNYPDGIDPLYPVAEYATLPLRNLGDVNESMLKEALFRIYGTHQVSGESFRLQADEWRMSLQSTQIRYSSIEERRSEKFQAVISF